MKFDKQSSKLKKLFKKKSDITEKVPMEITEIRRNLSKIKIN